MNATDEVTFGAEVERYRRELQIHCYRMLGSFEESEDLVQETFLRAWRKRDTYEGRSTFRAWLYRIATNACLDALDRRPRVTPGSEISWLQPFPDRLLDEGGAGRGRARRHRGRQGDDRARLPGRDPVPAGEAARGPDPPRRARLVGEGDGLALDSSDASVNSASSAPGRA